MKLLFLHHQQRSDYQNEPGYNELFRPLSKAKRVTGTAEFVYQTLLRQLLIYELALRGKVLQGNPTYFIMQKLDAEAYSAANLALQPILEQVIKSAAPDLIVYSLTWPTEAIHPAIIRRLKVVFPKVKWFVQQWDYEEGAAFFHSVERETISVADCYAVSDSHERLRRIRARMAPYQDYRDVEHCHWLPTVFDPTLYRPLNLPKTVEVLVLGSSEGYRQDVIAALSGRYGERFRHLGGYMPTDKFLAAEDYVEAINRAKIVVNTQTAPQRVQVKGRVREVLSCGGFLLEQDNPESRAFLDGSGVRLFGGVDQLFELIDTYLRDQSDREQIAHASHLWYKARYTPDILMQSILDAVGNQSSVTA